VIYTFYIFNKNTSAKCTIFKIITDFVFAVPAGKSVFVCHYNIPLNIHFNLTEEKLFSKKIKWSAGVLECWSIGMMKYRSDEISWEEVTRSDTEMSWSSTE
jgi:hypothetical protein